MPRVLWDRLTGLELIPLAIRVSMGKTLYKPGKYLPPKDAVWDKAKTADVLVKAVNGPGPDNGFESILEFVDYVALVECTRLCTHELVRHRIASYVQSSTRLQFEQGKRHGLDDVWHAENMFDYSAFEESGDDEDLDLMMDLFSWNAYASGLMLSATRVEGDDAIRYMLTNSLKAHVLVKMNLRSLLNFLVLRLHPKAHHEIRELAKLIARRLQSVYGVPVIDMLSRRKPGLEGYYRSLLE